MEALAKKGYRCKKSHGDEFNLRMKLQAYYTSARRILPKDNMSFNLVS